MKNLSMLSSLLFFSVTFFNCSDTKSHKYKITSSPTQEVNSPKQKINTVYSSAIKKNKYREHTGFLQKKAPFSLDIIQTASKEKGTNLPQNTTPVSIDHFTTDSTHLLENYTMQYKINYSKTPTNVKANQYMGLNYIGGHGAM